MEQKAFDIISILAVIVPTALILLFIPINLYLKRHTRRTLKIHGKHCDIKFVRFSPQLLNIWMRKEVEGKRVLLTRFFFSYTQNKLKFHGQALFINKKLLDLKYYPPEYQDPNGKFPIMSANDEIVDDRIMTEQ